MNAALEIRQALIRPALLVALCLGCSSQESAPPPAPGPARTATNGAAPAVDSPAVTTAPAGGILTGTITLREGEDIPPETMIPILTDPQFCEKHGKQGAFPAEDYVIDAETRGIRYVIVALKSDALRKWPHTPRQDLVLDNRDCRFDPHIGLLTVGSTIEVKNSDEVYHTTHLYGPAGYQFNPGLRTRGESEKTELARPGMYLVKCDRHGWMQAFLRVDDHPFHAVTDEKGRFEIAGIPPGTHQVEVFHEKFGELPNAGKPEPIEVTIETDQTATLDLTLSH